MIGVRSIIGENVTIRDSYLMGIDYYEQANQIAENQRLGRPNIGIGAGSVIERAIIDKNARIGRNVQDHQRDRHRRLRGDAHPRDPRRRRRHPQVHDVLRDGLVI